MGNIVGLNMEPWAVNQIKLRQQLLGLKQLPGGGSATTSEVLAWQTNSTPWIRAVSSVDISEEKSRELTGTSEYAGRRLSKEFVLFNGTVSLTEQNNKLIAQQRFGVTNNESIINNYAYGLGGTEQGIVPMPGIESLSISTYNRGSLRKAELKIKAHNKKQFAIIDSLYMRPGFTLLLEWGHTIYYIDTEIKDGVATKLAPQYKQSANFNTDAFRHIVAATPGNATIDQDLILSDIRAERAITNGNYDGFYGKITNFSWTYNVDGTYDITVSAISVGDVIESLNVNRVVIDEKTKPVTTPKSNPKSTTNTVYLQGTAANGQTFTREFSLAEAKKYREYYTQIENLPTGAGSGGVVDQKVKAAGGPKTLTPPPDTVASEEKLQTALLDDRDRSAFNEFLYEQYNNLSTNLKSQGTNIASIQSPNSPIANPPTIKSISLPLLPYNRSGIDWKDLVGISTKVTLEKSSGISGENVGSVTRMSKNFPFLYIRLGSLLAFIQNNLLYYNTPKEKTDKVGTPCVTFDLDEGNYCFTFPSQYSLNPNVCVIPFKVWESNDTEIKEGTTELIYWENILGTSFKTTSEYVGNLLNIHVNIHHIAALLKSCTIDNSLPLLRFLEALMADIQSSLGSVNKFTVAYDHDTNKIKIYDDIPLDKSFLEKQGIKDTSESVAKFNILGLRNEGENLFEGSFIRNIGLTTTITNALATMISVGAQAQTPSDITNATGFMKFNRGLVDSIAPNKISKVVSNQPQDDPNKVLAKAYTKLKAKGGVIYNLYREGVTPTAEMIDSQQTSAATVFRAISSKYSTDPESDIPTQSFIPFNLNLEMDGFSGPKIYEKFTITTDILPPGYPETLNFVIKGLSHSVSSDSWTTSIESLTLAK
jgi:hypothetical protein